MYIVSKQQLKLLFASETIVAIKTLWTRANYVLFELTKTTYPMRTQINSNITLNHRIYVFASLVGTFPLQITVSYKFAKIDSLPS